MNIQCYYLSSLCSNYKAIEKEKKKKRACGEMKVRKVGNRKRWKIHSFTTFKHNPASNLHMHI